MNLRQKISGANPSLLVLGSFLFAILTGTLLLKMPQATVSGHISLIDALFTATSAVCVTGLIVVDTGTYFTLWGQSIILFLIQVGGLGIITISIALFRSIGRSISFKNRMMMQGLFTHTPKEDIFSLVRSVIFYTLGTELIGAFFLFLSFSDRLSPGKAFYFSVFHSISAFCNAGFALFPDSFMSYSDDLTLNITICTLIIIGGIGFPVLYEVGVWLWKGDLQNNGLSVHTRVVLWTSILLIVLGAFFFFILEKEAGGNKDMGEHILVSFFQSITCRTAGFNSLDIATLTDASLAIMILLMFFGASPGSCGGGVKTTTLAVLIKFAISKIRRERRVNFFKKSIPQETVNRSISLLLLSIGIICIFSLLLLIEDALSGNRLELTQSPFLAYLFEVVSAFGTVGLSMGATSKLTFLGKFSIILIMIVGRVGVLTFSYIVTGSGDTTGVEYAEENLMIG